MLTDTEDELIDRIVELSRQIISEVDQTAIKSLEERRDRLLEHLPYRVYIRSDTDEPVLVLYPESWIHDGIVDPDRIDSIDEAIERPLSSTVTEDDWADIHRHNMSIAKEVADRFGPVHGANIQALASFLSNHYLTRIEDINSAQLREFRDEYFVRNAWPTVEQKVVLDRSIKIVEQYRQS